MQKQANESIIGAIAANNTFIAQQQQSFDDWQAAIKRLQLTIDTKQQAIAAKLWGVFAAYPYYFAEEQAADQSLRADCEREHQYRLDQVERGVAMYAAIKNKARLQQELEDEQAAARYAVHLLTTANDNESTIIKNAAWASLQQTQLF